MTGVISSVSVMRQKYLVGYLARMQGRNFFNVPLQKILLN